MTPFDWDDARVFLAIARARSLTSAARKLGINQSTAGRRLDALERALRTKVFYRTPDGYVPTPAGENLVAHAERMEEDAIAIAREIAGQADAVAGRVCITAPDAFGPKMVAPLIARMQSRWPALDVELIADNRTLNLARREADVAVHVGRPRDSALVARRLPEFGYGVYVARSYVAACGMPKPDFEGHRALAFEESSKGWIESRWLADHARKARVSFRCNSTIGQVVACEAGAGFGVLPCYLCDHEPELVRVLPEPVAYEPMWLLVHRDLQHAARIRAVGDFLVKELGALSARIAGTKRPRRAPASPSA
jgi:DNA-binding transcriptional LysR family regulator